MLTLNRRNLVWLIPLLMIITFPAWRLPVAAFLAPRGAEESGPGPHSQNEHNFVMQKVIIVQNQQGKKTAEIRASQAFTSEIPDEFVLTQVDADLFDEQGDRVNVQANSGVYNTQTRKLTLVGDVKVNRVSQNQQLFSELLYYFDETRVIDSPGAARLVGNRAEIRGSSLHYDIVTAQYKIGGPVFCVLGSE
ncbi:MAG: LPS export ABC transporter periplasmic protein LptC [Desulfocapsaceae bacterium]|jgi:LPS export ABC transporter protein LptC